MSTAEDRIIMTDLRQEMSRSYLEYAMSVIVGRALPDARDGLKPVHRRILYAMNELGLAADRPFRKCARVVGEVLGKYHPHGDTAVYDALVRLAQDFSMRHPLINGHGNFGSIDNDPAAAMRYTECRLQALTSEALLQDIEAETVDFIDTFDGSQQEPTVLPARLPQLLLNGSSGIAVGMATNIPPHNLGELVDGLCALIQNPEITNQELMRWIPGPDFPTGAQIFGTSGIREAYLTGRGSITMRGVAAVETIERRGAPDREAIIITELPYQTNKAALIERIADLVNEKRLEGISDIRDESDRDGMRIVIELKRDARAQVVLNNLYKHTPIQANFGANMLALVNGEPRTLTLKEFLQVFLDFRVESIERRTRYELRKAEERDHILQGYLIALSHMDSIIALIRRAADTPTAKQELMSGHSLSEPQADAILQMQLRRLTALEADKIDQEHDELQTRIADLQDILARRDRVLTIIEEETQSIKARFATPRRTTISRDSAQLEEIDLIANDRATIVITEQGYIKRMPVSTFETQNRATRGKTGAKMKDDDEVQHFLTCCDRDRVLFFSDRGVVYALSAYQIPASSRAARGTAIVQLLPIPHDEKITSVIAVSEFSEDLYLVMLTQQGYIKKTVLSAFGNIRANGLIAISLEEGDQLRWVRLTRDEDSILIGSRSGMAIHFRADRNQLRPLGRTARGVRAMSLKQGDELVAIDILPAAIVSLVGQASDEGTDDNEPIEEPTDELLDDTTETSSPGPWVLVITARGYGKRVPVEQFKLYNRATKGKIATKFKSAKGIDDSLAGLLVVNDADEITIATKRATIVRQSVNAIPIQSRGATGVMVQRIVDDTIAAVALVPPEDTSGDSLDVTTEEQADSLDAIDTGIEAAMEDDAIDTAEDDAIDSDE